MSIKPMYTPHIYIIVVTVVTFHWLIIVYRRPWLKKMTQVETMHIDYAVKNSRSPISFYLGYFN